MRTKGEEMSGKEKHPDFKWIPDNEFVDVSEMPWIHGFDDDGTPVFWDSRNNRFVRIEGHPKFDELLVMQGKR